MIDLKRPLEGVPGLLLMAAVALVGVAVGFSLALSTAHWVGASDGLANLWGGIIGAGLGAALAVMGAVYVQRRDRTDALIGPANEFIAKLEGLRGQVVMARAMLDHPPDDYIEAAGQELEVINLMPKLQGELESMPFPYELGRVIWKQFQGCQVAGAIDFTNASVILTNSTYGPKEQRHDSASEDLGSVVKRLDSVLSLLRSTYQD